MAKVTNHNVKLSFKEKKQGKNLKWKMNLKFKKEKERKIQEIYFV